jgi:hypothetical protein
MFGRCPAQRRVDQCPSCAGGLGLRNPITADRSVSWSKAVGRTWLSEQRYPGIIKAGAVSDVRLPLEQSEFPALARAYRSAGVATRGSGSR